MTLRCRRAYDHRIREQIVRTGNPDLFSELEIPRRTALSWIRRGVGDVVTVDHEAWQPAMRVRVANLERRITMLTAVLRLVLVLLRISGFELERARVCGAADKRRLLSAIERARRTMPLTAALRVLRLSAARYHAWARADGACALDDRPSCPRSIVQRLTYSEVATKRFRTARSNTCITAAPECSAPWLGYGYSNTAKCREQRDRFSQARPNVERQAADSIARDE